MVLSQNQQIDVPSTLVGLNGLDFAVLLRKGALVIAYTILGAL